MKAGSRQRGDGEGLSIVEAKSDRRLVEFSGKQEEASIGPDEIDPKCDNALSTETSCLLKRVQW